MKTIKYIITGLFVIGVAVLLVRTPKEQPIVQPNTLTRCFVWDTEQGDSASLELTSTDPAQIQVQGTFTFAPAQKDSRRGSFAGAIVQENGMTFVKSLATVFAEGMETKEEFFIALTDTTASFGFGEMTQESADSIYVYATPEKISYTPTLQEVSCTQELVQ